MDNFTSETQIKTEHGASKEEKNMPSEEKSNNYIDINGGKDENEKDPKTPNCAADYSEELEYQHRTPASLGTPGNMEPYTSQSGKIKAVGLMMSTDS